MRRDNQNRREGAPTRRFDWPELILATFVASLATAVVVAQFAPKLPGDPPELIDTPDYYEAKYGPRKESAGPEEWIIRDWFQDKRGGVFLDVGAGHARENSNTWYLETKLDWSGLAIDAQPEYAHTYSYGRMRTRFVAAFVSDTVGDQVQFFVAPSNKVVASGSDHFVSSRGLPHDVKQLPTTTLNAILEQARVEAIDFLNLDIELYEPQALKGFDIDKYQPSLACVEAHEPTRDRILTYFYDHGYRLIGKYLRVDQVNLYFTPR